MSDTCLLMQCHLKHENQARLMMTAIKLAQRLNPDVDILMIDNASFLDPLPWCGKVSQIVELDYHGNDVAGILGRGTGWPFTLARFAESIGHFHYDRFNAVTPKDGPGRAIMSGLRLMEKWGYKRGAYMESDGLGALPLQWAWDRLTAKCGAQPRNPYGYLDGQIWWFADLPWLIHEAKFPDRYDWPSQIPDWMGSKVGELQWEELLEGHTQVLPVRGGRCDALKLADGTMRERFEEVADFVTHTSPEDFAVWLELNGHADLIPTLMGQQP